MVLKKSSLTSALVSILVYPPQASSTSSSCNHEKEIADLKKRNQELDSENQELKLFNDELKKENSSMREKFEELFTELSIKEAQWCEKEEQLNLKVLPTFSGIPLLPPF